LSRGKRQKHTVIFQPSGRRGIFEDGKTILEASKELGVDIDGICGGKATCGKCKVRLERGVYEKYGVESKIESLSPIGEGDRKFLSKKQLRDGYSQQQWDDLGLMINGHFRGHRAASPSVELRPQDLLAP